MIEFSCPIRIKEDFVPPPPAPVLLSKSLSFLLLNVLTLGVYGTIDEFYKKRKVEELDLTGQNLQRQASSILQKWGDLEAEIDAFRMSLQTEVSEDATSKIETFNAQLEDIARFPEAVNPAISAVAWSSIEFVGQLFKNIFTLGFYGVYQNYTLRNRVTYLEAKNAYVHSRIEQDVKIAHRRRIGQQVNELSKTVQLKQEMETLAQSEVGRAYMTSQKVVDDLKNLQSEHGQLQTQLTALRAQKLQLEQTKAELEGQMRQRAIDIERLRENNSSLRLIADDRVIQDELDVMARQRQDLANRIEEFEEQASSVRMLEQQLIGLQQAHNSLPPFQRMQSQLGPVPSKYEKRAEDTEVKGAYGIDVEKIAEARPAALERARTELGESATIENVCSRAEEILKENWSDYAKRCNGKHTAAEVLKAEFDFAFDELLRLASEESAKIVFNRSAAIYQHKNYDSNKKAIYSFMALDLIKEGELFHHGHGYALKLNGEGVAMRPSLPERVQGYRIDPVTRERTAEVTFIFKQIDEFTPSLSDRDTTLGVDPVSAKWIYEQLNEDEREHLFNLLMEPLIPNDNPRLQATKSFMRQVDNERVKLVGTAYELIFDIGTIINKKFDGNGIFVDQWKDKANDQDENCLPLRKEEVVEIPQGEVQAPPPTVAWQADMDTVCLRRNYITQQPQFGTIFEEAKRRYQCLYANLSREAVGNTSNIPYISQSNDVTIGNITVKGLRNQFYSKHYLIDNHGCLMSNLLAVLLTKHAEMNGSNVQRLKNAMAAYLDKPEVAEQFKSEILRNHRMSVAEYQQWLRGSYLRQINNYDLGDVEIKLVAQLFGVRIAVFYPDAPTKLNEQGLTVPADDFRYYGPNTKEVLFLYNSPGHTYYSMWPKLVVDRLPSAPENVQQTYRDMMGEFAT